MTLDQIVRAIGVEPYHLEDAGVIYNCDCLDILPKIPDKSIDLVLTDPPYGISMTYGENVNDSIFKTEWINICLQKSPKTVFTIPQSKLFEIPRPDWIGVWFKPFTAGYWNTPLMPHWEAIAIYGKEKSAMSDVFQCNPERKNEHPCPKPLSLYQVFIGVFGGNLILDPFLGSGTTAVAAKQLGRKFIGIEIEEKYCKIAVQRLAQGILL